MNLRKGIVNAEKAIQEVMTLDPIFHKNGVWVCVGSNVTGTSDVDSDIDLLLFIDGDFDFVRKKTKLSKISACAVPKKMLLEDALTGKYGGYFAAKLFSPNFIVNNDDTELTELVTSAPALYFYPFLKFKVESMPTRPELLTYDMLAALSLEIFFDCNPLFYGWWIRNEASKDKKKIWDYTVNQFKASVVNSGIVYETFSKELNNPKYKKDIELISGDKEYKIETFMRGVRHWIFGVQTHDNDFEFANWAYDKYSDNMSKYGGASRSLKSDLSNSKRGKIE